jgi:DNA-binding IclR family transcriptional regulator
MESAYLGVHDQGDSVLYLAQAASPHAIRHGAWIGQVVPLQGTAIGAALRDEVRPDGHVTARQTVEHRHADSEHAGPYRHNCAA